MYNFNYKNFAISYEPEVDEQVKTLSDSHIFDGEIMRLMPDCHSGKGCVIGTVLTFSDKIIPNITGVDLGCRVSAFNIGNIDIDFEKLDNVIQNNVPSGHSIRNIEHDNSRSFNYENLKCWSGIQENEERFRKSMGTLGGGNHFIAIEVSKCGNKYLMVHCGSRNLGLQVANYYQNLGIEACHNRIQEIYNRYENLIAEKRERGYYDAIQQLIEIRKQEIDAEPSNDLCYIEGKVMENYLHDVHMMREWSYLNHKTIAEEICEHMGWQILDKISSIHNYIDVPHKIIRKGAIAAYEGQKCLIPLNMAEGTLICVGKGNEDYLYSAPHGAGRIMSRSQARKTVDMEDYKKSMDGIYSSCVCNATIDESPQAYKNSLDIVNAIGDTVDIIDHLHPIYNFKAKG